MICIILCLCCLVFLENRTKWFCCLHLVVVFPFLLFCFEFCIFCSFIPLKKRPKNGHSKNTNKQKRGKKEKTSFKEIQLAQLCSQMVFLILGVGCKIAVFAENPIKTVVSAYFEKGKRCRTCEKGWIKNLSEYAAQHTWTDIWLKKWYCLLSFFWFEKSRCPCRNKNIFENTKWKQRRNWTDFLLKKGKSWTDFWHYSIQYIYNIGCWVNLLAKVSPFLMLKCWPRLELKC